MRIWHDNHEKRVFFKYLSVTLFCFIATALINFGLIVKNLKPVNIILPFIIGSAVGTLLGYNALLRARLTKSNNTKTKFLSRMNHELRTPMNAILGFAELLHDEGNLSKNQKDSVDRIVGAGKHTLNLINELLDFASVETGKIKLDIESLNVVLTIDECIHLTESVADKAGVTIHHNDENARETRVLGDELRFKQVMINLISNGIKYNRQGGTVTINYSLRPNCLRIAVTDTGKGIDSALLPYLFEPFNRLGAENTKVEGTGIGLSIAKQLVELMNGRIGFESAGKKGATFWLELPYDRETGDRTIEQH